MFSVQHMIIIFVVVLIVFGPQKLPELARGLGKLMAEFRKASADFKGAFEQEMRDMERQAMLAERKKQAEAEAAASAAASQPATPATSVGPETPPVEATADIRLPEAPVVTQSAESIPRSADETAAAESSEPAAKTEKAVSSDTAETSASRDVADDLTHDFQRPA